MAFKKIVRDRKFWRSVAVTGIAFVIIYHFIAMLFEHGSFAFAEYFGERFKEGRWLRTLIITLLAGFVYGFLFSYGQFRSQVKKEGREP